MHQKSCFTGPYLHSNIDDFSKGLDTSCFCKAYLQHKNDSTKAVNKFWLPRSTAQYIPTETLQAAIRSSVLDAMYIFYVISDILYNVSLLQYIMYSNVLQLGSSSEVPGLHSWFQLQRQDQQTCVQYAMFNQSMSYIESKKYKCCKTHADTVCIISPAIP